MKTIFILPLVIFLSACQTPANIQQLNNEKEILTKKLNNAAKKISRLKSSESTLKNELTDAKRVINVIGQEKTSRITESTSLRGQIRHFVQSQIDALKAFLLNSNLLDYIGGELVTRATVDYQPALLIDLKNKIPRQGVLTGASGYFVKPTQMSIKVLRKVKDKLVVIWESRTFNIKKPGLVKMNLPVTVGVEKNDVIGYYFPKISSVSFDKGTGDTRYLSKNLIPGSSISISALDGSSQRRAYSLGVYALLK